MRRACRCDFSYLAGRLPNRLSLFASEIYPGKTMPARVKLMLSIVWLCTAAGAYVFLSRLGEVLPSYALIFLGVFATVAMWIFPEVSKKDLNAKDRR